MILAAQGSSAEGWRGTGAGSHRGRPLSFGLSPVAGCRSVAFGRRLRDGKELFYLSADRKIMMVPAAIPHAALCLHSSDRRQSSMAKKRATKKAGRKERHDGG